MGAIDAFREIALTIFDIKKRGKSQVMKANVLGHLSGFEKSGRIEKFEKG